jgi:signal recognition particle subunit SRP54
MTAEERRRPEIIGGSRKRRIANGSGTTASEINQLLAQFRQMQGLMKQLSKGMPGMKGLAGLGGGLPSLPGLGQPSPAAAMSAPVAAASAGSSNRQHHKSRKKKKRR